MQIAFKFLKILAIFLVSSAKSDKCVKDIIVLLDTSASVGEYNFETKIKPFLKKLERNPDLNVSPLGTHIAILAFSSSEQTKLLLSLDDGYGEKYRQTVNGSRWSSISGGYTRTDLGFKMAGEIFKDRSPLNYRTSYDDVILLITDGEPTSAVPMNVKNKAIDEAQKIKDKGVLVIGLGVGNVNMQTLEAISSPGEAVMATIEKIHEKMEEIVSGSCKPILPATENVKWNHDQFTATCIQFHNFFRAAHNSPPLQWDNRLEESSQGLANHLNTIQKMEHYKESSELGSNIFLGAPPKNIDHTCLEAVVFWYKENEIFDFDNPSYSDKTGHFTAMVWRSTKIFGLGEAGQASGNIYVVASYYPAGNLQGAFKENVQKLKKMPSTCIKTFGNTSVYELLMDHLGIPPYDNKYIYRSEEPCVLPTWDEEETKPPGSPDNSGGSSDNSGGSSNGKPNPSQGVNGPALGATGPQVGKGGGGAGETGAGTGGIVRATSKTPNQILIVPVGEPKVNPELIFAPPQPAPQKTPQIILLPGNQFQVPAQQPPCQRPETTPRLSPQVTCSTISTAPLNSSTVRPSSTFVSSTVSQTMTTYVSILVFQNGNQRP